MLYLNASVIFQIKKGVVVMITKKVIVTNNKKACKKYENCAEVIYMENAHPYDIFSSILKNKKEALEQKNQCIKNTIKELTYEIENLPHSCESAKDDVNGIPFTFIPYMYCPICSSPLRLESASLSNNKLTSGDLSCACGYESHIEDGVILCDGYTQSTPFKAFKNIESVVSITEEFGKEYRILIDKAYMWMYHHITRQILKTSEFYK